MIANPILKEESAQIAFDYLGRSGEIDDVAGASQFLNYSIELIIERKGGHELPNSVGPGDFRPSAVKARSIVEPQDESLTAARSAQISMTMTETRAVQVTVTHRNGLHE
jgi:hypothetical protein